MTTVQIVATVVIIKSAGMHLFLLELADMDSISRSEVMLRHPDGSLVILKEYPAGSSYRYGLEIETGPGSLVFTSEGLFTWT